MCGTRMKTGRWWETLLLRAAEVKSTLKQTQTHAHKHAHAHTLSLSLFFSIYAIYGPAFTALPHWLISFVLLSVGSTSCNDLHVWTYGNPNRTSTNLRLHEANGFWHWEIIFFQSRGRCRKREKNLTRVGLMDLSFGRRSLPRVFKVVAVLLHLPCRNTHFCSLHPCRDSLESQFFSFSHFSHL